MRTRRNSGFTLLELLVVVAILAIVSGGVVAAFDGLESKSAKGTAANSIINLDKTLRTYRVLNNGNYPNTFDSLLVATTTGTETNTATVSATTAEPLVSLPSTLEGKLTTFQLTAEMVDALDAVGITEARYIGSTLEAGALVGNAGAGSIPTRVFDSTPRGRGISKTFAVDDFVAVVEADGLSDFGGDANTNSNRLRDIGNLDDEIQHIVVAFGVGNNSSFVKNAGNFNTGLAEAPVYSDLPRDEYGRYIALFHIASDDGADGAATADDGTIDPSEVFGQARLLAVCDTKLDWFDEEIAEYTGQKP